MTKTCRLISVSLQISKVHLRIAISQSIFELETISWPFFGSIFHVLFDGVKKFKVSLCLSEWDSLKVTKSVFWHRKSAKSRKKEF